MNRDEKEATREDRIRSDKQIRRAVVAGMRPSFVGDAQSDNLAMQMAIGVPTLAYEGAIALGAMSANLVLWLGELAFTPKYQPPRTDNELNLARLYFERRYITAFKKYPKVTDELEKKSHFNAQIRQASLKKDIKTEVDLMKQRNIALVAALPPGEGSDKNLYVVEKRR